MATVAIAPAPARAPKRNLSQERNDPNRPVKRARRLNFDKCSFCRKDKKRCQRVGKWPDAKCQRCIEKAFECSEPVSSKVTKVSEPSDHEIDDDDDSLLERIRYIQNQSCWLEDQQSIRRDADAIYRDYLEYSDAEASRRYHNFVTLVDEAEEEIAISRRDLFPILKTSHSSHQLVYTHILSSLLPGAQSLNMFHIETDLMSEAKFEFVAEQIDELHRLSATGLAKAMQESLVTTIALLVDTSPLRLQREADKLNQLDAEFSSAICEELDGFGFSPVPLLLRAPNLVDYKIIKAIMVQSKQEPTMTDSIGRSVLHIALERPRTAKKVLASHDRIQRIVLTHDDCQIVKALLDWGVPLGIRDIFGRTALHLASFYSWSLKAIKLLIEASDHDIDAKDVVGHTAFSWAVKKSNMELAKQLLATGEVDVNTKDKYGYTPLYFAVKASDVSMVRMLLARDDIAPSINIRGELCPQSCAWGKWDMEILSMFSQRIHHSINGNGWATQHSTDWRSLLSMAATEGKVHAVRFLLTKDGIDASSKSRSGMTALDWARKKGHAEIVALLEDHERRSKKVQEEGFGGKEKDDEDSDGYPDDTDEGSTSGSGSSSSSTA